MHAKNMIIPAGQLVALFTTVGCTPDAVPGDWDATTYRYDTYTFDLTQPLYEGTYNGVAYSYDAALTMSISEEGTGTFVLTSTYTYGTDVETYSYDYALTGEVIEKSSWSISIPDLSELELTCDAEDDAMTCSGSNEFDGQIDIDLVRAG